MTVEQRSNKEPILTDGVNPRNQNQSHPGTAICVSTTLYVPLPGFGPFSDRRWMQSGCKADAKWVAGSQPGCKLHAEVLQSRCISPEWMQTRRKPIAKTMQSASCSVPPRAPPPIVEGRIDGPGTPNPAPQLRNGEKRPSEATGLPATSPALPPRGFGPSQCASGAPSGTEVCADPLALAGDLRCSRRSVARTRDSQPLFTGQLRRPMGFPIGTG